MKNRLGIILLVLFCVGLSIGFIWAMKQATETKTTAVTTITTLSNNLAQTSEKLEQQKQFNTEIEGRLDKQKEALVQLTNALDEASTSLQKTEGALKSTQDLLTQRDARITDLEAQNQALDQRASELSFSITNLTRQITDTRRRLAASEGDKEMLTRELQQLIGEKAELERKFNDISVLRAQVAKVKEELNVSRRLDWMRKGLLANSEQKGAEQLMQKSLLGVTNAPPRQPTYDLNVEVSADGSVRVIPPLSNSPAATRSP